MAQGQTQTVVGLFVSQKQLLDLEPSMFFHVWPVALYLLKSELKGPTLLCWLHHKWSSVPPLLPLSFPPHSWAFVPAGPGRSTSLASGYVSKSVCTSSLLRTSPTVLLSCDIPLATHNFCQIFTNLHYYVHSIFIYICLKGGQTFHLKIHTPSPWIPAGLYF